MSEGTPGGAAPDKTPIDPKAPAAGNGSVPDGLEPAPSDNPSRPDREAIERAAETRHRLAEMRHDPDTIRRLFENGEYPYQTKIRTAVYERQKKALQVELSALGTEETPEQQDVGALFADELRMTCASR